MDKVVIFVSTSTFLYRTIHTGLLTAIFPVSETDPVVELNKGAIKVESPAGAARQEVSTAERSVSSVGKRCTALQVSLTV